MTAGSAVAAHPCEQPYLPFDAQSQHWADVEPVFQDDGPADVLVQIMYDPAYSSAMDLFRALYPRKELSPRTLALTAHLASLNPSSYSVWSYRADILIDGTDEGLGSREDRLIRELEWMEEMARGNMKSYQVWQHRRLILSALGDPSRELAFIASVLDKDAKNYHTWAYRQWVLAQYAGLASSPSSHPPTHPELWDGELAYTDKLLTDDVRNNSAWNHRFFVVFARGAGGAGDESEKRQQLVEREVGFTKARISSAPSNAAAWAYLRGVLAKGVPPLPLTAFDLVVFARNLVVPIAANSPLPLSSSAMALEYLLDAAEEQLEAGTKHEQVLQSVASGPAQTTLPQFFQSTVSRLAQEDPVRRKWWAQRGTDVQALLASPVPS
ncbi:unnamed protein product [Parajaminaea phylloscopi]